MFNQQQLYQFEEIQGDDIAWVFNFKDVNQNPVDITGWILYLTIKDRASIRSDSNAVYSLTLSNHINPLEGQTVMEIPHTASQNLKGVYQYDIQLQTPDNKLETLLRGSIKFVDQITQRY